MSLYFITLNTFKAVCKQSTKTTTKISDIMATPYHEVQFVKVAT